MYYLEFSIVRTGVDVVHDANFIINRPHGTGDYLLACFTTPIKLYTLTGTSIHPPGTCILYPPGMKQWYQGNNAPFRHHWIHFDGPQISRFLSDQQLPAGYAFSIPAAGDVSSEIARIQKECLEQRPHWQAIAASLLHVLLCTLARQQQEQNLKPHRRHASHDTLRQVRRKVHQQLHARWTVAAMASMARLSKTRFSVLYHEIFGISPIEDLLGARLQYCCWLLTNTQLSVSEIAGKCGFDNLAYFSRQFRKRIGCPPSDYLQQKIANRKSTN